MPFTDKNRTRKGYRDDVISIRHHKKADHDSNMWKLPIFCRSSTADRSTTDDIGIALPLAIIPLRTDTFSAATRDYRCFYLLCIIMSICMI
jgi:hypothetical protein